ncbi:MAG: hypothetical protein ISR59_11275 [Anaerolineales bacterium]|uniref:N-acetyltransferase domain-containing protein n=1 Tax=Candidatus Desulfolinea nitratireducens TaxID=2841698 RepID=A0A8J6NHJ8_9CHLR|nr:hypothetical protein [Candidatus Desulfolinea nitratireducens]MBL6961682.1 hypothetical protein [Anaerolineales bacterium]
MKFSFELAQPSDDPALRKLLAESPMPGRITVAFEREPNYFMGCSTMGPFWQTIIFRHTPSQEIAGVLCRAVRSHFINGKPQDLGYVGQIRIAEKYRSLWLLHRGLSFFRELHADGRTPTYLGVISAENRISRGILVERRRRNFPSAQEIARIYTLGIILRNPMKALPFDGKIERGSSETLPEIVIFLQEHGTQRQFFPVYSAADFTEGEVVRDFDIRDFIVARRDGQIIGVLGLWDQSGYKQSVVREYDRSLRLVKPFYNLGARLLGAQPLPNQREHIHSAYASFICIANDDANVFAVLLRAVYNLAAERRYAYLMLGLTTTDSLLPLARKYPHIDYHSQLYLGSWENENDGLGQKLDNRIPYIEIATL